MPGVALPASMEPTLDQLRDERLYTPVQAGQLLGGLSRSTIYRLMNSRQLRYVECANKRFITAAELRRFVASLSQPPAPVRRGLRRVTPSRQQ